MNSKKALLIYIGLIIGLIAGLGAGVMIGMVIDRVWLPKEEVGDLESGNLTAMHHVTEYVWSTGLPIIRYEGLEPGWDCDDYARKLTQYAMSDNVEIGLALEIVYKNNKVTYCHMSNFVIIGNRICKVSAQTGAVTNYWYNGLRIKVD